MGDYDFTQIIQNVFVGNRSLDRFLFLLNNNELSFKIKGGTAYDGSTNQAVFQRKAKHIKHRSKKSVCLTVQHRRHYPESALVYGKNHDRVFSVGRLPYLRTDLTTCQTQEFHL